MRTLVLAAAIALALPYAGQADSRRPMSADAALAQGQKGSYIVSFIEPAAPLFTGFTTKDSGRPKLAAVAISVTGRLKYDPQRPEAQAYLDYIGDLREQRLDRALRGANLGTWDWNISNDRISVDTRWAAIIARKSATGPSPNETAAAWARAAMSICLPPAISLPVLRKG